MKKKAYLLISYSTVCHKTRWRMFPIETFLVFLADLHELQREVPAVHLTEGIVGIAVEEGADCLAQPALADDRLLQQAAAQGEQLVSLL